jgi:hypothetical protein
MLDQLLSVYCLSREVWHIWLLRLHLQFCEPDKEGPALGWWLTSRKLVPKALRRGFDSFFLLMGWMIWKERNARTFNGVALNVVQLSDEIQI